MENTVTVSPGQWILALAALIATLWVVWTVVSDLIQKPDQHSHKDDLLDDLMNRPDWLSDAKEQKHEAKKERLKAIRDKALRDGFTDERMRKRAQERDILDSFESAISPMRPGSAGWYATHGTSGSSRYDDHCGGSSSSDSGGTSGGSSGGSCGGGGGGGD